VILAVILAATLFALAGVHLYWAFGGRWPGHDEASMVEHVVGRTAGMRAPGPLASAAVAAALAAGGLLVLAVLAPTSVWSPWLKAARWVLFAVFALWLRIVWRLARGVWREGDAWTLPKWLLYAVACVLLLFVSGFVARPETNFVVADFWRWAVIHMWVEAFFEVFTTALLAYFMVLMGFVSHAAASRIVYLATLLFLGSGLLGISHNFYWNAKPVATLAIGSIFSTLQVVPLILLTLEAWQFRNAPRRAGTAFAQAEAGRKYETILKHYYPGSTLSVVDE